MKFPDRFTLCLISCSLALVAPAVSRAAAFTDIGAGLTGLYEASTAWGDYDNDGDLDIAVVGNTIAGPIARIYRNTAGAFADASALPATAAVMNGALAWGDYDNDGDLDLAIAGDTGTGIVTRIYRNNGGTFADIAAGLEGVKECALSWVDFDNDGDLDLAVVGNTGSTKVAHLYRNTSGVFADAGAGIPGGNFAAMGWCDYDLDGDHDAVISGFSSTFNTTTTLYRNTAGVMSPVVSDLPAVQDGSMDWGDYDNDGDQDLLISGNYITQVWRNTAGNFANSGSLIQGSTYSSAVWGDYDNDGRPDIAAGGATGSVGFAAIYHNDAGSFSDISAGLPNLFRAALAWGDYDNDGDLDLLAAGSDDQGSLFPIHRVYRCSGVAPNNPPGAPTNLSVTANTTTVTFHWNASTDAQGAPLGLSYNLWAGTAPGTANVMSPMANLANGYRRVARVGNVGQNHQWTLARGSFAGDQVYWGVQAIDQAFAGSAFATGPSGTLSVGDAAVVARLALRLAGANPSRSDSRLAYALPRAARVDLEILDLAGRSVRTLASGERAAGEHQARWSGEAADGSRAAPGVYFARLSAGGEAISMRILRIE
jgi:hypothetical protein